MTTNLTMRNFYNILLLVGLLAFTTSCEKTENILIEPTSTNTENIKDVSLIMGETIKPSFLEIEDGTTVSEDGQEKIDAPMEYMTPTIKITDGPLKDPIETVEGTTIEIDINKENE